MNRLPIIVLSILSGLLMMLAWPPLPTAILLFVGLVPLIFIRERLEGRKKQHLKFWAYTYLAMFIFNTGTTWWVWNASASGSIMMLFLNSLIMSLPFLMYSHTKQVLPKLAYPALVLYVIATEYWHFNWSAAWPWLTLGKGLSSMPWYIQWYEFTGELGGTALIVSINVLLAKALIERHRKGLVLPTALFVGFGIISLGLQFMDQQKFSSAKRDKINCVVSQPNIDPYEEKFGDGINYLYPEIQLDYALEPAEPLLDDNTDLLLFPETAVTGYNDESDLNNNFLFEPLRKLSDSAKLCIITGAESFAVHKEKERPTLTARYDSAINKWFDFYNTAVNVKKGKVAELYHKSKLVPGVEKMPFAFLEQLSINLGGTSGSLGTSDRAINFTLNNGYKVAPLICYESVFGDYACEYVRDGANLLAVVTNDGWWGNTPGYQQHLMFGSVRCIETRRDMVRSANTGVSAYIDRYGKIHHPTKYKERTAFKCITNPYSDTTFYVRFGNLLGKFSLISIALVILVIYKRFTQKTEHGNEVETIQ